MGNSSSHDYDFQKKFLSFLENFQNPDEQKSVYQFLEKNIHEKIFWETLLMVLEKEQVGHTLRANAYFELIDLPTLKNKLLGVSDYENQFTHKLVGNLISLILLKGGVAKWPNLFESINLKFIEISKKIEKKGGKLDKKDQFLLEANLDYIFNSFYDQIQSQSRDLLLFSAQFEEFVPYLLNFSELDFNQIKIKAIQCLNLSMAVMPVSLKSNILRFLKCLYANRESTDTELKSEVYAGIYAINQADLNFDQLLVLTIEGCSDITEVAKISWDFVGDFILPNLSNNTENKEKWLQSFMNQILNRIKYAQDDIINFLPGGNLPQRELVLEQNLLHESEQINKCDDFFNNEQWTLRRICASLLVEFAHQFQDMVYPALEKAVQAQLLKDWRDLEAQVFCMGLVAMGVENIETGLLISIIGSLVLIINDQNQSIFVVGASIWSISQCVNHCYKKIEQEDLCKSQFTVVIFDFFKLVQTKIYSMDLYIQKQALKAFFILIKKSPRMIQNGIEEVLECLGRALGSALGFQLSDNFVNLLLPLIQYIFSHFKIPKINHVIQTRLLEIFSNHQNMFVSSLIMESLISLSESGTEFPESIMPECFNMFVEILQTYAKRSSLNNNELQYTLKVTEVITWIMEKKGNALSLDLLLNTLQQALCQDFGFQWTQHIVYLLQQTIQKTPQSFSFDQLCWFVEKLDTLNQQIDIKNLDSEDWITLYNSYLCLKDLILKLPIRQSELITALEKKIGCFQELEMPKNISSQNKSEAEEHLKSALSEIYQIRNKEDRHNEEDGRMLEEFIN